MSDHENYSTTKDLGKAVATLVFLIVGVPVLRSMIWVIRLLRTINIAMYRR